MESCAVAPLTYISVGLEHGHMGSRDPDNRKGLLGTFDHLASGLAIRLVGIHDPGDPVRLARESAYDPPVPGLDDLGTLVDATRPDFAVVALPAAATPGTVLALIRAGIHCFVEKTPARTAAEWQPVVDEATRSGRHVHVNYPWRFHPAVREMRRLVSSGDLGRPLAAVASMFTGQVGPGTGRRDPRGFAYRPDTEGGGMLHWLGAHFVEALCAVMGDVTRVSAVCAPVHGHMGDDPRMDDASFVTLRFAGGAVGNLQTGYLNAVAGENRDLIRVWGTEGDVHWPSLGPMIHVGRRATGTVEARTFEIPAVTGVYGNSEWMVDVAREFVTGIRTGTPPEVDARAAMRVLEVLDAAYRSSGSGTEAKVSPSG